MRVLAIGLAIAVIVFVVRGGHVLFLPLLFLPLGLFSFGHRRHAAARCSHHGEGLAGSSAATLWQVWGVPIAHIRALARCRAAGPVFASWARPTLSEAIKEAGLG